MNTCLFIISNIGQIVSGTKIYLVNCPHGIIKINKIMRTHFRYTNGYTLDICHQVIEWFGIKDKVIVNHMMTHHMCTCLFKSRYVYDCFIKIRKTICLSSGPK